MSRPLVLVTEPPFRRGESVFTSASAVRCQMAPSDEEGALAAEIRSSGARHVIVGDLKYREALYASLPRGSVIARMGVGFDGIDLVQATSAGLLCTNTPGVLDQSVAELTMFLLGAAARHLGPTSARMTQGHWTPMTGQELAGKTLAIIGSGRIGRAIARIATKGFGMRVVGFRRTRQPHRDDEGLLAALATDFDEAVRDADFISLNIPGSPENARFLNADRLSRFRPSAWLINTARGSVVDEAALYDALSAGRLAGAALDVFDREPYVPVDPTRDLRTLPNVILMPHIGSNTVEANQRMAERALRNVELGEAGMVAQMDLLNPAVLPLLAKG